MWWFKEVVESKLLFSNSFPRSSLTGLYNFTNTTLICHLYREAGFLVHVPYMFFLG